MDLLKETNSSTIVCNNMINREVTKENLDKNNYINKPLTHLVLLHLQLLPGTSCWSNSGLVPPGHEGGRVFWHKSSQIGTCPKSGIKLQVQFFMQLLRIYVSPGAYSVVPSAHWDTCPKGICKNYKINWHVLNTARKIKVPI